MSTMPPRPAPGRVSGAPRALPLLRAAHGGPAIAVTVLSGLLAVSAQLPPGKGVLVVLAVLAGQLSVGWSNDYLDAARDRLVGRLDKPLVTGEVSESTLRAAWIAAACVTVVLSLSCGVAAGCVHLLLVAIAWSYNVRLKATIWSALPFAVSFGGLPVFVYLADTPPQVPPAWLPLAAALLGVAAHLVNALPDLEDDAASGVCGLPHRLGARTSTVVTVGLLLTVTGTIVLGSTGALALTIPAMVLVAGLTLLTLLGSPTSRFRAVVAIALVDTLLLVAAR